MSLEIGRPKEDEQSVLWSRHMIFISYALCLTWAQCMTPKTITTETLRGTDHTGKIIMKNSKYFDDYWNVTQRPEVSTWSWKNSANKLAECWVATNFHLLKKHSTHKTKPDKRVMPVFGLNVVPWSLAAIGKRSILSTNIVEYQLCVKPHCQRSNSFVVHS